MRHAPRARADARPSGRSRGSHAACRAGRPRPWRGRLHPRRDGAPAHPRRGGRDRARRHGPEASAKAGGEKDASEYADVAGFCKSAPLEEIRKHGHVLTPGRYVGAEAAEDDGEPFGEKMQRLAAQLREQQAEAAKLDAAIAANLKALGYAG